MGKASEATAGEGTPKALPHRRGVQWRIMAWHLPLLVGLLAIVLLWLAQHLGGELRSTHLDLARRSGELAVSAIEASMESETAHHAWSRVAERLPAGPDTWLQIINLEGKVLYATDETTQGHTYALTDARCAACHEAGGGHPSQRSTLAEGEDGEYVVYARPLDNGPTCIECHEGDGAKLGMVYVRQTLASVNRLIGTTHLGLVIAGILTLILVAVTTKALLARYIGRPLSQLVAGARAIGQGDLTSRIELEEPTELALLAETLNASSARLQSSIGEISQQRDNLQTLYLIAEELSRSSQPDVMHKRAVELASTIFGSSCVLITGHFHADSHAFHGTVTYWDAHSEVVEQPFPAAAVSAAAPYYDATLVQRWLDGELTTRTRSESGATVAFPLTRRGLRLALILAPARALDETADGRATAADPEVERAWGKHLAAALELTELQRDRLRQERLAAIGETVAGLSHCLKNTLNGLQGGQYVTDRALEKDDPALLQQGLSMLRNGIRHIEALSFDMLYFAGDRPLQPEPVQPSEILQDARDLLAETARSHGIDLRLDLDEDCADPVPLDRHTAKRALLNLITNAIDACADHETGDTVVLRCRYLPEHVVLSVEDNGAGIPEPLLRRVTERFFTTKASKGTGLGLPVVQKIVDQHGGTLEVKSAPGEGATFYLRFPRGAARGSGPSESGS